MPERELLQTLWADPSLLADTQAAWPARIKPLPDELLSSWLMRLAMAHGLKLHTFCSMAWPRKAIWNRDIDKSADSTLLPPLAYKTLLPIEAVKATTLSAYEGLLYEHHNPFGNTVWIMPVGVYHRTRRNYGLQFCPHCLARDKEPYWRRRWRLAFVAVCHEHAVTLHDRCPECSSPINFHRNELGNRAQFVAHSLVLCHSCGFDLRKTCDPATNKVTDSEICLQKKLLQGINEGCVEIVAGQRVYALLYFMVLHQVLRLLATGRKADVMRTALSRMCGVESSLHLFSAEHGRDIDRFNVAQRRSLLIMADYLLGEWPERFIEFCRRHRVWSSTLLKDFENAPFWFWRVVHDSLYRTSYCPSDEEVRSAISYITKVGGSVCTRAISKCLGVNDVFRKRKTKTLFGIK